MSATSKTHYIIILCLVAVIIIQRSCQPRRPEQKPVKPEIVIRIDSIPYDTIVYVPKPYKVTDSIPVPYYIGQHIDTAQILAEYNKVRYYSIPIKDDSVAKLTLKASVYQNILTKASLSGDFYSKTVNTTKTIEVPGEPRNKVYIGFQIQGNVNTFGVAPSLMLSTKRDHVYSAGYDPLQKQAQFSTYWKIHLWDNK